MNNNILFTNHLQGNEIFINTENGNSNINEQRFQELIELIN